MLIHLYQNYRINLINSSKELRNNKSKPYRINKKNYKLRKMNQFKIKEKEINADKLMRYRRTSPVPTITVINFSVLMPVLIYT